MLSDCARRASGCGEPMFVADSWRSGRHVPGHYLASFCLACPDYEPTAKQTEEVRSVVVYSHAPSQAQIDHLQKTLTEHIKFHGKRKDADYEPF